MARRYREKRRAKAQKLVTEEDTDSPADDTEVNVDAAALLTPVTGAQTSDAEQPLIPAPSPTNRSTSSLLDTSQPSVIEVSDPVTPAADSTSPDVPVEQPAQVKPSVLIQQGCSSEAASAAVIASPAKAQLSPGGVRKQPAAPAVGPKLSILAGTTLDYLSDTDSPGSFLIKPAMSEATVPSLFHQASSPDPDKPKPEIALPVHRIDSFGSSDDSDSPGSFLIRLPIQPAAKNAASPHPTHASGTPAPFALHPSVFQELHMRQLSKVRAVCVLNKGPRACV